MSKSVLEMVDDTLGNGFSDGIIMFMEAAGHPATWTYAETADGAKWLYLGDAGDNEVNKSPRIRVESLNKSYMVAALLAATWFVVHGAPARMPAVNVATPDRTLN